LSGDNLVVRFGILFPSKDCYSNLLRGNRAKMPAKASENCDEKSNFVFWVEKQKSRLLKRDFCCKLLVLIYVRA